MTPGSPLKLYTLDELLTAQEAAKFLKVHVSTLVLWLRMGRIEGFKVGHNWRIYRSALERFQERG